MQLRQQGNPVAGQPVEQVDLPQRTGPVHGVSHNPGDLLLELTKVAGGRHAQLADVVVQIDVAVHPLRVRDTERHLGEVPAQRGQQVQPRSDQLHDVGTGHEGFVFPRLVEDDQTGDVHRGSGVLGRQEEGVEAVQAAHARAFRRAVAGAE